MFFFKYMELVVINHLLVSINLCHSALASQTNPSSIFDSTYPFLKAFEFVTSDLD